MIKRIKNSCLGGLVRLLVLVGILMALGFGAFSLYYFSRAKEFDLAQVNLMPERTLVLDRNGKELGKIHGENRTVVDFEQISPFFLMSIIAREDVRFYRHFGVDIKGLLRATLRNIKDKGMTQGASTITMQLARNTFDLSQGKGWKHELDRKFLEIYLALIIERKYTKTEILKHYCNRIFWGHSMLGIEAASQAYLQKPAQDLTLAEGAMLAGIVRGPNAFSPFRSIKLATRERNTVLDRLVYYSFVSAEEAQSAKASPLKVKKEKIKARKESYAMNAITRELTYHLSKYNIKIGGLTVHTTIDKDLQSIAERSINSRLEKIENLPGYKHQTRALHQKRYSHHAPAYLQGALVCMENSTGGIVVSVGGRSLDESRFNRAYSAKRQIGSLFKPFVFQAAFDRGLRPQTLIDDSPLKAGEIDFSQDDWNPGNSDNRFLGLIETQKALLNSRNTSSVRVGDFATMLHVQHAAEIAGFKRFQWEERQNDNIPNNATSYLGSWEATPEEVTRAYSIFPNKGHYRHPYIISKIVDRIGNEYELRSPIVVEDPLSQGATYEVSKILENINIKGTGSSIRSKFNFKAPSAGKTGTTDDYKDAWYAGYTSSLTCAVWVGLDTPKRIISKGYGSRLALPIWADLMKAASQKLEFRPHSLSHAVETTPLLVCNRSARRANEECLSFNSAYEDFVPNDLYSLVNRRCSIHLNGKELLTKVSIPTHSPKQSTSVVRTKITQKEETAVGTFLKRLLGHSPPPPPRAIVIEDEIADSPRRAIIVDEPDLSSARRRVPIVVKPNRIPEAVYRERRESVKLAPKKAILVDQYQDPPPKAILVE